MELYQKNTFYIRLKKRKKMSSCKNLFPKIILEVVLNNFRPRTISDQIKFKKKIYIYIYIYKKKKSQSRDVPSRSNNSR